MDPHRYKSPLAGREYQAMHTLFAGMAVLKKHGVTHWVDTGTLLGFIRDNGIMPHDTDVDVSCLAVDDECMGRVKEAMLEAGFAYLLSGYGQIAYVYEPTGVIFDTYWFNEGMATLTCTVNKAPVSFGRSTVLPVRYLLGGIPTPAKPEVYLRMRYGESWRTPTPSP